MYCHHCNLEILKKDKIGRQETCPQCGSLLHCCLNCRFYDSAAYHQCRETEAEWVNDKAAANFCEYFEPRKSSDIKTDSKSEEARKKLERLFKKSKE